MSEAFLDRVADEVLIMNGAMGTMLHQRRIAPLCGNKKLVKLPRPQGEASKYLEQL